MKLRVPVFFTLALFASFVFGEEAELTAINQALKNFLPGQVPDSITKSPMPGIYEVIFGPEVIYMSEDGRYILKGDLIDLVKKTNLTETKRSNGRLEMVNGLGEESMIIFTPKEPKYTVTVFTDVDCSYCRRMHRQMKEYNDAGIKIRYASFPRTGLDTPSYFKAVSVWCAKDRNKAMTLAKAGGRLDEKHCENPVADHLAAGMKIGVSGTPSLVLEDGSLIPGYIPPRRLAKILSEVGELSILN